MDRTISKNGPTKRWLWLGCHSRNTSRSPRDSNFQVHRVCKASLQILSALPHLRLLP